MNNLYPHNNSTLNNNNNGPLLNPDFTPSYNQLPNPIFNNTSNNALLSYIDPQYKRRKRARHPELWKRNNYKRKQLKDKGACNCTRKCFQRVDEIERNKIKLEFSALSKTKQNEYLLGLISIQDKKLNKNASNNGTSTISIREENESEGEKENENDNGGDDDEEEDDDDIEDNNDSKSGLISPTNINNTQTPKGGGRAPKLFNSKYSILLSNGIRLRVCHFAFLSMHFIGKKRVNNLVAHAFMHREKMNSIKSTGNNIIQAQSITNLNHTSTNPTIASVSIIDAIPINLNTSITGVNHQNVHISNSAFMASNNASMLNPFIVQPCNVISSISSSSAPIIQSLVKSDLRGRHSTRVNRVAEILVNLAESHIGSFPRYISYNAAEDITTAKLIKQRREKSLSNTTNINSVGDLKSSSISHYLSPQLSLVKMYRLFVSNFQPILNQIENHSRILKHTKPKMKQELNNNNNNNNNNMDLSNNNDTESLEITFTKLNCSNCDRAPDLYSGGNSFIPLFWKSNTHNSKVRKEEHNSNNTNYQPLLGLFCSSECCTLFIDKFMRILTNCAAKQQNSSSSSANIPQLNASDYFSIPYSDWHSISNLNEYSDSLFKPLLSRDKYERLFRSCNLKFGSIKKDSCPLCTEMNHKLQSGLLEFNENKQVLEENLQRHLLLAKKAYEVLEHDKRMASTSWNKYFQIQMRNNNGNNIENNSSSNNEVKFAPSTVDTLTMGFQCNRPFPQISSNSHNNSHSNNNNNDSSYYKRQMHVYSYGLCNTAFNSVYNYLWDQRTGRKKTNELLSLFYKYIIEQRNESKLRSPWLIMIGDNSFRNFFCSAFLCELTREESIYYSYRRIDYKLLETGHCFVESDRFLAGIEKEGKLFPIYKPNDWVEAVKSFVARKGLNNGESNSNYTPSINGDNISTNPADLLQAKNSRILPKWLNRTDLYDWKAYLANFYTKQSTAVDLVTGSTVDLSKCVWFNYGVGKENSFIMDPNTGESVCNNQGPLIYHPDEVWVKYSLSEAEPWKKVRIRNYENSLTNTTLNPLYAEYEGKNLGINYKKAKDLFEVSNRVAPQFGSYYPPPNEYDNKESLIDCDSDIDEEFDEEDRFITWNQEGSNNDKPLDKTVHVNNITSNSNRPPVVQAIASVPHNHPQFRVESRNNIGVMNMNLLNHFSNNSLLDTNLANLVSGSTNSNNNNNNNNNNVFTSPVPNDSAMSDINPFAPVTATLSNNNPSNTNNNNNSLAIPQYNPLMTPAITSSGAASSVFDASNISSNTNNFNFNDLFGGESNNNNLLQLLSGSGLHNNNAHNNSNNTGSNLDGLQLLQQLQAQVQQNQQQQSNNNRFSASGSGTGGSNSSNVLSNTTQNFFSPLASPAFPAKTPAAAATAFVSYSNAFNNITSNNSNHTNSNNNHNTLFSKSNPLVYNTNNLYNNNPFPDSVLNSINLNPFFANVQSMSK